MLKLSLRFIYLNLLAINIIRDSSRYREILTSDQILDIDKEEFLRISNQGATEISHIRTLKFLSDRPYKVYEKKIIILIDEYTDCMCCANGMPLCFQRKYLYRSKQS